MVALASDSLDACTQCGDRHPRSQLRCPKTDVMLPLRGRVLDGRFCFVECIGRGGMASVWLAVNERVDRRVAIKLIRPDVARDEDMVARFRAEARAAGRIGNPNICDILDSGISPIGPYIVMELLEGRSLGELLAGGRRMTVAAAVMVVRDALRGLQAAHRAGIVHRDLKPENVFVHRPSGAATIVKLMDFGVAKFTDGSGEAQTAHGALLGTPEYMAPEQFRGAAFAEPRTDVWATGAILYRALTGKNAFGGATVAATLLAVTTDQPPRADVVRSTVPSALADVIERCLAKSPEDRFVDAAALDEALAPFDTAARDDATWTALLAGESEAEAMASPAAAEPKVAEPVPTTGGKREEPMQPTRVWGTPEHASPRRATRVLVVGGLLAVVVAAAWAGRDRDEDTVVANVQAAPDSPQPDATTPSDVQPTPEGDDGAALTSAAVEAADSATPTDRPRVPPAPILDPTFDAAGPIGDSAGDPIDDSAGDPSNETGDPTVDPALVPPEDVVVVSDDDPKPTKPTAKPSDAPPPGPPPPDPPGVVRDGRYVALLSVGPPGTHRAGESYCKGLASAGHLDIRGWELPNPTIAAKFARKRGIRKGRYWTSALWRGNGLTISLPSGKKQSTSAKDTKTRVFCVAKWP